MMIYVLVPHAGRSLEDSHFFTSFSLVEQRFLAVARSYHEENKDPDWGFIVAYEGIDQLYPVFLYTLVGTDRLRREPYPSPSP
jgi:hypothetical protein